MRNLLPHKTKQALKREYYMRVGSSGALLFSGALLIGIAALTPSYFLLEAQEMILREQYAEESERVKARESGIKSDVLRGTEASLSFLRERTAPVSPSLWMSEIITERPEGIRLTSFFYRAGATHETESLSLSGVAENREAILAFKRMLERDPRYLSVKFPISNLAENQNIAFSAVLTGIIASDE